MLKKIGQKISRMGDVIEQPRLLTLHLRGIEVRMFECLNKPWLLNSGIRTVLDVGANVGQFARAIHEVIPQAFIYSFEPLPGCFRELHKALQKVRYSRAFNTALADTNGETVFYRSEWSPSSSLLPMGRLHKENFPFTAKTSEEIVQVRRLDDFVDNLDIEDNILLKLDVQGSEDKVIIGAKRVLQRTKILIVETSMEPLYDGQSLFGDIFNMLDSQGFRYKGALAQSTSPIDENVLYADAIFIHDSYSNK